MAAEEKAYSGVVQSISDNLGAFFRHLLPGILIMGTAWIAHPRWFPQTATSIASWQQVLVLAAVAFALGNVLFAFNRYVILQLADWVLYRLRIPGPIPSGDSASYQGDVGDFAQQSLCAEIPARARQHVGFRVSAVLLLYTVAENGFFLVVRPQDDTVFAHSKVIVLIALLSITVLAGAIWQNVIARRLDFLIVSRFTSAAPTSFKTGQL